MEAGWSISYGVGSRRFYAIAVWPAPEPLIVQACAADQLCRLIREAEQTTPKPSGVRASATSLRCPPNLPHPTVHYPAPSRGALVIANPDGLRTVCWDLPHDLSMIGKTRGMVNDTLAAWALGELADDVVLVVDELLANAINYGDPPIRLSLWASAGELCVRVTDHGSARPRHLDLGIDAIHGRGLTIVAALSHSHGITPLPDAPGKTVWACWRHGSDGTPEVPADRTVSVTDSPDER